VFGLTAENVSLCSSVHLTQYQLEAFVLSNYKNNHKIYSRYFKRHGINGTAAQWRVDGILHVSSGFCLSPQVQPTQNQYKKS
jgi:hypothetical protein